MFHMSDSVQKEVSFERAVLYHVWKDFKSGFGKKFRLIAETLLAGAIAYVVHKLFANRAAADDLSPEVVLILFGTATGWLILHAVWSFATAPRAIYKEQQLALKDARSKVGVSPEAAKLAAQQEEDRQRLEHIRAAIRERADDVPIGGYQYSVTAAMDWETGVRTLLRSALTDAKAEEFEETVRKTPGSESGLEQCAVSLKTIAATLRTRHLRE